jgi:hypothetical protein
MDQAAIERLEQQLGEEVDKRFPGSAVQRVKVLQYGDEPMIEPGELHVRLILEAAEGPKGQKQALHAFAEAHDEAFKQFRKDLSAELPNVWRMEVRTASDTGDGPRMVLGGRRLDSLVARVTEGGGELTPVMARLGRVDLETLDALITAGIAASRAEAVRWALARIRERPAYTQLRERAREIERLKTEF